MDPPTEQEVEEHEDHEVRVCNQRNHEECCDDLRPDFDQIREGPREVAVDLLDVSRQSVEHSSNWVLVEEAVNGRVHHSVGD